MTRGKASQGGLEALPAAGQRRRVGEGDAGEMVLTQQKVPLKIYQLNSKEAGQGWGITMGTWIPLSPGPPGHTLPLPTLVTHSL